MELKGHACLQAWQRCQPISKWSSEGWQDLLSPLSSYSCSFFQFRFSPGTLPLPEQQVAETQTPTTLFGLEELSLKREPFLHLFPGKESSSCNEQPTQHGG